MTPDQLHSASKKDLADRATKLGIAGASRMNKDELVRAITRAMKKREKEREKAKAAKAKPAPAPAPSL
ncbi:MAG: Rho termination factor N-terminal domain-containing protein, partial [Zavarzinella sp.]|nr:Rho termination factor N-terminal domain-containing protein [Zavarzinella sp.]